MTTVINNNERIYQVISSLGKQWFCNIEDLNTIVKDNQLREGYFKIYDFWNNKPKKVSQKNLKLFFEGANLKQDFYY